MWDMSKEKINACIHILEELYGVPQAMRIDPVDLLVMTILSQNTSDTNSLKAFGRLKTAFRDPEALLAAPEKSIADAIRPGGLAEIKARRIKLALYRISRDFGVIDLGSLAGMSKEKAMDYLTSLPGVGPKTASVVLLFGFGMPFMPVDTHVHRVSMRLGLVPKRSSVEAAQRILESAAPSEKYLSLHLNLIKHGRLICRARGPKHDLCALRCWCDCVLQAKRLK